MYESNNVIDEIDYEFLIEKIGLIKNLNSGINFFEMAEIATQ
jgi:hypothetical protein